MKKIILASLLVTALSSLVSAQKISTDKVPSSVAKAFKAKFPSVAKVNWEIENKNEYEATFKKNGEEVSANFSNEGKWLETETEIKVSAFPQKVSITLKNDYAGFKINEASKIESLKDGNCYEAEVEKGEETFDVLIKPDGKVLSKTKTEGKED